MQLARKFRVPLISLKVGRELECYVIGDTMFVVSDHRIVIHSSQATVPALQFRRRKFSTSTAAAHILEHFSRQPLRAVMMQARLGRGEKSPTSALKLLRDQVNWLRNWSPDLRVRLGPVVVAEGIAQFHPNVQLTSFANGIVEDRISLRVQLSGFSDVANKALKGLRSSAPGAALESLALNACLRDFSLKNRLQLSDSHLLLGLEGGECARMLVIDRGALWVNFEFDGTSFARGFAALTETCMQLGPKNMTVEVVHRPLPGAGLQGRQWVHQALGSGLLHSSCQIQARTSLRSLPAWLGPSALGEKLNDEEARPAAAARSRAS